MAEEFKSFVGSESCLEVCALPHATRRRFAQEAEGWQALARMVALQPVPLVVNPRPTGGLERSAARPECCRKRRSTRARPDSSPRVSAGCEDRPAR